jgi:hypothetical protein
MCPRFKFCNHPTARQNQVVKIVVPNLHVRLIFCLVVPFESWGFLEIFINSSQLTDRKRRFQYIFKKWLNGLNRVFCLSNFRVGMIRLPAINDVEPRLPEERGIESVQSKMVENRQKWFISPRILTQNEESKWGDGF